MRTFWPWTLILALSPVAAFGNVKAFPPGLDPRWVIVKFRDGSNVAWRDGAFRDRSDAALRLGGPEADSYEVSRSFPGDAEIHRLKREALIRKGVAGRAHKELYFSIRSPTAKATRELLETLSADPRVASAYVPSKAPPSPTSSTTPDLSPQQRYLADYLQLPPPTPPPLRVRHFWDIPGGTGAGVRVLDIEYGWDLAHEDLPSSIQRVGPPSDFPNGFDAAQQRAETHHGTASLGIIAGQHNGFGVDGIAPDATILVAASWTSDAVSYAQNVANAIDRATSSLSAGDVMLLEVQMPGPRWDGTANQSGLLPAEWDDLVFNAIQSATDEGIVVVEAAGNGSQDLDDAVYQGKFDRSQRDSAALIVTNVEVFTQPGDIQTTNSGSRVDLYFWNSPRFGVGYTTTGYGDVQDSSDDLSDYTETFNASSACSAAIAGCVASFQGIAKRLFGGPLTVVEIEDVLRRTGNATDHDASSVGVRPRFDIALRDLLSSRTGINPSLAGATLNPSFEEGDRDWHRHRLAYYGAGGTQRNLMGVVDHKYSKSVTLFFLGQFVVPFGTQALTIDWRLFTAAPDGAPCDERTGRIWLESPSGEAVTLADLDYCTPLLDTIDNGLGSYTYGTDWRTSRSPDLSAFAGEVGTLHVEVTEAASGALAVAVDNIRFESLGGPVISSIQPATGPICGGTEIAVTGSGFTSGETSVRVGGTPLVNIRHVDTTLIVGQTPQGAAVGGSNVEISNVRGANTILNGFSYEDATCAPEFRRGDCNNDGAFDLSDAIFGLNFLFTGGNRPACEKACDSNDDGSHDISDASRFLGHLFLGAAQPPDPYVGCGQDGTADSLDCGETVCP